MGNGTMNIMRKGVVFILAGLIIVLAFFLNGCNYEESVDYKQKKATDIIMTELNNQVGLPDINNFYEKKLMKDIYELRDDSKLTTYAYFQALDGKMIYLGKCIGFGLPYSVQYSNPEKIVEADKELGRDWTGIYPISKPQAEPNGLFMPEGLSATWLIYINPDTGKREIIYTEPSIIVTQSKLPKRLLASWSIPEKY